MYLATSSKEYGKGPLQVLLSGIHENYGQHDFLAYLILQSSLQRITCTRDYIAYIGYTPHQVEPLWLFTPHHQPAREAIHLSLACT